MESKKFKPAQTKPLNNHLSEALIDAIKRGASVEHLQTLLQRGADVNAHDCQGKTPLLLASNDDNEDRVQLLINAGADVNYKTSAYTPLHYAVRKGWLGTIRLLAEKGANLNAGATLSFPPIILACARQCNSRQEDVIELLINLGADINFYNVNDYTLLHFAAEFGWVKIGKLLLERGANPNAVDVHGSRPLHNACKGNQMAMVKLLLKAGADCYNTNENGKTPFRVLIEKWNNVELIRVFMVHGMIIRPSDYYVIVNNPLLKEGVLRDIEICSLSLMNKFNNKDLALVYATGMTDNILPSIEFMDISKSSGQLKELELTVEREIDRKGFCNILEVQPLVLSMMVVKSLLEAYFCLNNDD